jgi:hypothetical protein
MQRIKRAMKVTYIQMKVNKKSYKTLLEFLEDVDLIIKNAEHAKLPIPKT